jgi:hypothetical protein
VLRCRELTRCAQKATSMLPSASPHAASFGSFGDSFSRRQLHHVPYVRGPRRISKYRRLQIFRRESVTDRKAE